MADINSFKMFLNRLGEYKLLSSEEEVALVKKAQKGDQSARNKLIECNMRLVVAVVKHYQNCGMELEDLVQVGVFGLIHAISKFDFTLGYKFSTYAVNWIRQYAGRAIADQSRAIRIPVHMNENINRLKAAERELTATLGKAPTEKDLAKQLNLTVEDVKIIYSFMSDTSSLDEQITDSEGNGVTLGATIEDTSFIDPLTNCIKSTNKDVIREVLSTLSPREEKIMIARFGLEDGKPRTLEDIGKDFGLSKERIRQIENIALRKLRNPTRAKVLKELF